jgi:HK97 family phage major capsid protein
VPPTLLEEYTGLREQALAMTDKAMSEDRQLTEEETKTLGELVTGAKGKWDQISQQKTATALIEQAKALQAGDDHGTKGDPDSDPEGGGTKVRRSFGELFIESQGYKAIKAAYPQGIPESADLHMPPVQLGSARGSKALVYVGDNATAGGSSMPGVPPDFRGFIPPFFYQINIFNLLTRSATSSELVEYVQETSHTNAAAPVPEAKATSGATYTAAGKPESAVAWVRVATAVRTIATYIPVTTKTLSDVPQARDLVDAYLMRFLTEALANQVVNGDGTGENLLGIIPSVTAHTPGTATEFVLLRQAQQEAELYGTPNAWLMNPSDVAAVDYQMDSQNRFYGNGPFSTGPRTLWGLPLVAERAVPAGTAIVGDFSQCVLYDREAASVQVGTINDQFTHNMRTLLAEERAAFGIFRPAALKKVAIAWT